MKISSTGRRKVNKLIFAAGEHAFVGSYHPDVRGDVEDNFKKAKDALIGYIAMLEETNARLLREAHGG